MLFLAISRQLWIVIENALNPTTAWGSHPPTVVMNFFSYFTILSNFLAAIVLLVAAIWAIRHRIMAAREPVWLTTALVCASTYMIVTGIVYNVLLRQYPISGISDVWTNETLAPHRSVAPPC